MVPIVGSVWQVNGKCVVVWRPDGALTKEDESLLEEMYHKTVNLEPYLVVVDFFRCPDMDAAATTALLRCYVWGSKRGIILTLAGAGKTIRERLRAERLEVLASIFPTVVDAMAAFAPPEEFK